MSQSNTMAAVLDNLAAKAEENAAGRDDEYIGEDGLLRCRKCDGPRQTVINVFGRERTVRCDCGCRRAETEQAQKRQQIEARERRRRACFQGTNMEPWNFANDDRARPELSDAMMRYADQFAEYRQNGKGMLLYGPAGTGKTFLAACVANRLIDNGYTAHMTNFAQVANHLQSTWEKQEYIDELCGYDLLIVDDLGTERKSEFMQEQVFNVIDARYRSGRPLLITSNLTQDELGHPANIEAQRIYDRILERCLPVHVDGKSRRRQTARTSWNDMREQLGI